MNPHALKNLADRASGVDGRASERLAEVHARILTARRRRAARAAAGTAGVIVVIVVIVAVIAPGTRAVVAPIEPAGPQLSCATGGSPAGAAATDTPARPSPSAGALSVRPLAGSSGEYGLVDGEGTEARFESIEGFAVGPTGAVYLSDYSESEHQSRIRKVSPAGQVSTVAELDAPTWREGFGAVTVDPCGTVYAVVGLAIRRIGSQSKLLTLAGDPTAPAAEEAGPGQVVDGFGTQARFGAIVGMAAAPSGDLYVTDAGTVRRVTPQGKVTTLPTCPAELGRRRPGLPRLAWRDHRGPQRNDLHRVGRLRHPHYRAGRGGRGARGRRPGRRRAVPPHGDRL